MRLTASAILETLLSALIAPMLAGRMDQAAAKGSASGRDPAMVSM